MRKKTPYVNMAFITAAQSAVIIQFTAESEAPFAEFATVNFLTPENSMNGNEFMN